MSPTSQKIFKKMELFRDPIVTDSDLEPFRIMLTMSSMESPILALAIYSKLPIRSDLFQESQVDDMYLGLGAGDGRETPFVSRSS
jgi:hypothetical protein